ncbi:hypothetical protein [Sphingomonas sp. ACRSK]|uniref:hypothetical protein n=1 Tax=Sphingomonas sp. ACRSK TaxID=2918213 RepID=UPI001EF735B7|nr:hypothetical protein [Sphingomonas sp. ACRSK]MCG7348216.1 hypothetical protein [Sphingomonas sp. ACRSK]
MNKFSCALAGALLLCASGAFAQAVPAPQVSAPLVAGAQSDAVLRTGTKVALKTSEELTTKGKKLRVGQHFNMEVAEAVLVNGQVVIPAGATAVGEITEVRNKGMWGKSGHLTAQMLYVSVNGRQIRLTGTFDDKGVTGTAGVVGAIALVPVAGFLMTGTSAVVPMGAPVTGFIGEDVPVVMGNAAAPAPLVATASAPTS